jgi:hypothetical protein
MQTIGNTLARTALKATTVEANYYQYQVTNKQSNYAPNNLVEQCTIASPLTWGGRLKYGGCALMLPLSDTIMSCYKTYYRKCNM